MDKELKKEFKAVSKKVKNAYTALEVAELSGESEQVITNLSKIAYQASEEFMIVRAKVTAAKIK